MKWIILAAILPSLTMAAQKVTTAPPATNGFNFVMKKQFVFIGGGLGMASMSTVDDASSRDSGMAYGVQSLGFLGNFGADIRALSLGSKRSGNSAINMETSDANLKAAAMYRFPLEAFSPYLSLGGGVWRTSTKVTVQGSESSHVGHEAFFEGGAGVYTGLIDKIGLNLSVTYYQNRNITGYLYMMSMGAQFDIL